MGKLNNSADDTAPQEKTVQQKAVQEKEMKHPNKTLWIAAVLMLAAPLALATPAAAQGGSDAAPIFDRVRGELSPGTSAPTRAQLVSAIDTANPDALTSLLEYGEGVECLVCMPLLQHHLFASDDPRIREISAWWLRARPVGFAAIYREVRLVLQNDTDPVRRTRAAEAIGEFMDPHGIPLLTVALQDADANVRFAAVEGLGRINAPGSNAAIAGAFADADGGVREAAVAQVLYVNFFRDYDGLMGLLADDVVAVRRRAALAVGTLRVQEATPALIGLLSDPEAMVRQSAAWSLGQVGGTQAREALNEARGIEDVSIVRDAIDVALNMR